jgi:predicted membrane channel-forming protein YqfA (hemolysin III family)
MSLKGFHIVFVTVSTLLFVFLALWAFLYVAETSATTRALGITGIVAGVIMPVYGVLFYRKASKILI